MRLQWLVHALIAVAACPCLAPSSAFGEVVVRLQTNVGVIDLELFDEAAPITVANFLNYVRDGDFDNSFFHRSSFDSYGRRFVLQGGGYTYANGVFAEVPKDAPIVNEFDPNDPTRSNLRGTIAMAKLPSGPNTATAQWFVNLRDNAWNLDYQNGGFTVFGRISGSNTDDNAGNDGPSMRIVDGISRLDRFNAAGLVDPRFDGAWSELPVIGLSDGGTFDPSQHLVKITSARETGHLLRVTNDTGNSVTLTVPTPARLANLAASSNPDPAGAPAGVAFSEGFFSFQVTGVTPGGSAVVVMELPSTFRPNTYYMYGPTPDDASPHWYEFLYDGQTGAEFFSNNYVLLHFVDGQRGDADLTVNGEITDPGAPGVTAAASASSSSGGGCTLANNRGDAPPPLDYWLFALALLARPWWRARMASRSSDEKSRAPGTRDTARRHAVTPAKRIGYA